MNSNLAMSSNLSQLIEHVAPFDWVKIHEDITRTGGVIAKGLFLYEEVAAYNKEVDEYIEANPGHGAPASGSEDYNKFLGHGTVRLQGLIEKTPSVAKWIGRQDIVDWASSTMKPIATSVLLNAAELIQIGPGEKNQYVHRDTDSWPTASLGETPLIVNCLIALDEFTLDNGATRVMPGSYNWERDRRATDDEILRAQMQAGDALLFRGDILHGGGANITDKPRRALSMSYCVGWLRAVENSVFNLPRETVKELPVHIQQLLGFHSYDGSQHHGGLLGLYDNGDPSVLLQ